MAEVEIKLQVTPQALAAVRAAMRRGRCATTRLQAIYHDTPDQSLAAAGWALRLRREGRRWVQAIKGPADGVLSRFEHEVVLGVQPGVPVLDVARHAQVEGFEAFGRALGQGVATLAPVFETDVRRSHRLVRTAGALVEVALDEGVVVCGAEQRTLCELEFELKAGPVEALTALAARWAERHGLWLDTQTKAERGWLLARGQATPAPTFAQTPRLDSTMTPDAALRASVRAVLAQVLSNASALAAGRGGAEHVHQARVGLRRLLSIGREFGQWSVALDASMLEPAAQWFRALGGQRDVDALAASLLPQLKAAGAPPLTLADGDANADPGDVFRSGSTTAGLLVLLAFAHGGAATASSEAAPDLRALAAPTLARLHRRLRRAGKAFPTLEDEARHRARKQLKRLRYAAECLSTLWPDKAWQDYLRRLKKAQDALGTFQDLTLAQAAFEARREADPQAWFALGWIAARRPAAIARAGRALRALGRVPRFMR